MSLLNLNIHTIIVLVFLGNFIAVIILLMYKKGLLYSQSQSYGSFIAGKVLQCAAWPLLSMRGEISNLFSVYIGNSLLITGFALEALALTVLNKRIMKWGYVYSIMAASGIVLFWLFADSPNLMVGYASLAVMLLFLVASVEMVKTRGESRLRFIMGFLYGLFTIFLGFRSWYGFFYKEEFALMTPGFIQNLTFIHLFVVLFTGGIGFLLMLKEQDDILLMQSEEKYRTLVEKANEAIIIIKDEKIVFANSRMADILGISYETLVLKKIGDFIHPDDRAFVIENYWRRLNGVIIPNIYDFRLVGIQNKEIWVTISVTRITWCGDPALMVLLTDITERKSMENEREKIIAELRTALSDVRTLSGLLPICSGCKKIRDDKGYWNQIEVYIRDHSEADFSHSLCPDCIKKLYPDIKTKE